MSATVDKRDPWRMATLALWELFFLVGLFPGPVFRLMREAGAVLPQRALINSEYMLTIGLAGFFACFAYGQCRQNGLSPARASDMTMQYAILALVAFLPVDFIGVLRVVVHPLIQNKGIIYISALAKLGAWIYLMAVVCKYYLGNDKAFLAMPSLFPSTRDTD